MILAHEQGQRDMLQTHLANLQPPPSTPPPSEMLLWSPKDPSIPTAVAGTRGSSSGPEGIRDDSTPANTCLTASTNIPGWLADPSAGSTWPMHAQVHLTTWGHACLHACTHRTLYPDCQAFERYGTPVSMVLLGWSTPGTTSVCGTHIAFSVELQRFLGIKPGRSPVL